MQGAREAGKQPRTKTGQSRGPASSVLPLRFPRLSGERL